MSDPAIIRSLKNLGRMTEDGRYVTSCENLEKMTARKTYNRATELRLRETARMMAGGYTSREVGAILGVGALRVTELVDEARALGFIDEFSEIRDTEAKEMSRRRHQMADDALHIVQEEVRRGRETITELDEEGNLRNIEQRNLLSAARCGISRSRTA